MKKIILFTLLFALLIQTVAFAGAPKITIKRVLGENGETVQKVIVEGTIPQGEYSNGDQVTIRVLPSDKNNNNAGVDDYYVIGQTVVNEDGSYYFEKILPSKTGDTFVDVVSDKVEYNNNPLNIPDVTAISELIAKLNAGTISSQEVVNTIGTNNDNLLFDTAIFNSLYDKSVVIDNMKAKLGNNFNAENIYEEFDRYTLLNALREGNHDGKTILDNYERVLKLKERKEYELFKNMSDADKLTVYGLINNNTYTDYDKIQEKFFESVILTSVKEVESYINIYDILDEYKTELNMVSYVNSLSSSEVIKSTVLIYVINNKANINSLADLSSYIDFGIKNYVTLREDWQQSAPSGGGGGGGGGSSYKTDEKLEPGNNSQSDASVKLGFSDIDKHPWAKESIMNLYNNGIINGKESDKYYPDDYVTRAEFIKMVTVGMDVYDDNIKNAFSDTEGHWASKYIASAVKNGYINGVSENEFAPNSNITRQDAVVILYRILVITFNAPKIDDLTNSVFADEELISDYARGGVIMMNAYGIINGYEDNTFKPKNNLTRAEAAVIINKFMNQH